MHDPFDSFERIVLIRPLAARFEVKGEFQRSCERL